MAASSPADDLERKKKEYASFPDIWPMDIPSLTQTLTVEREDATWISGRIYEEVDRGLISADLRAMPSTQCIFLTIGITVLGGLDTSYVKKGLDILMKDIHRRLRKSITEQELYL
jgi:hypothetical protein